jgi:hypothetical protein
MNAALFFWFVETLQNKGFLSFSASLTEMPLPFLCLYFLESQKNPPPDGSESGLFFGFVVMTGNLAPEHLTPKAKVVT